jgi:hypothetical protein
MDAPELPRCEACADRGVDRPATTRSVNPDWAAYDLCEACAAERDGETPAWVAIDDSAHG